MKTCPTMQVVIEQLAAKHAVNIKEKGAHVRLDLSGFDRLCVERIRQTCISVAHFFESQGYLIPEPDVMFFIDPDDNWIPIDITQSVGGWQRYAELSEDFTHILRCNRQGQAMLAAFCEQWAQNLIEQGWLERAVKFQLSGNQRFDLGQIVVTPGALSALAQTGQPPGEFITRHMSGDWGDLDPFDQQQNEQAVTHGGRLLSAYRLKDGTRIWVITEWNRSATTLLLPEEY